VKFYFSKAISAEAHTDMFEHEGNHYYYMVEILDESFTIMDTCGRFMPFDYTSAKDFGLAAFVVEKVYADEAEISAFIDKKSDQLKQLVQFFSKND